MMKNNALHSVEAVVFDWAGTVIDYGCFAPIYGLVDAFSKFNVNVSLDMARKDMGLAKRDHIEKLLSMPEVADAWQAAHRKPSTQDDIDAIHDSLESMLLDGLKDFAYPIDGVVDMVNGLMEKGIHIGSTTGYTRPMMDVILPIAAEAGYCPEVVLTSSEVPSGRPAPWMCFENARRLGVYPMWRMVKVGDTFVDVDEGRNAGMWTVAVIEGSNLLGLSEAEVAALTPEALRIQKDRVATQFVDRGVDIVINRITDLPSAIRTIETRLAQGGRPGEEHRELAKA